MLCILHKIKERRGGIRTLTRPYLSASCRIQTANIAKLATDATDHCTLLHAGKRSFGPVFRTSRSPSRKRTVLIGIQCRPLRPRTASLGFDHPIRSTAADSDTQAANANRQRIVKISQLTFRQMLGDQFCRRTTGETPGVSSECSNDYFHEGWPIGYDQIVNETIPVPPARTH